MLGALTVGERSDAEGYDVHEFFPFFEQGERGGGLMRSTFRRFRLPERSVERRGKSSDH